ncbi:hypothetical protein GQ53DRAFT_756124 [Thozetella sp. PMI_491]|nr:hypothetical protein GQ53DRAFT_756124 [Thozetella sp. PMI_491]
MRVPRRSRACTTALRALQGLSGIPEVPSSGLPSPPSSPPLAAITATNELALTPKTKSRGGSSGRGHRGNHTRPHRRGGAALRIREECERFFCETLRAMFLVERNTAAHGSGLTGVYDNNLGYGSNGMGASGAPTSVVSAHGQLTPPDDFPIADKTLMGAPGGVGIGAWLEIWDYAGGASFRAFVSEDIEDKTLFVFFDNTIVGQDLKPALVALIELADGPLACAHMTICIDRSIPKQDTKSLTKGLQWAGFSLTTLDFWAGTADVTSDRWITMGMEL